MGEVAQRVGNLKVVGSNPPPAKIFGKNRRKIPVAPKIRGKLHPPVIETFFTR
jgi:hypothetical protein